MKKNSKDLADTYSKLSGLFVGYLGEDYYDEFKNYEEAVNAYIRDAGADTTLDVIAEIDAILKDKSIEDLGYSIVLYLCCAYDYERQGLTVEQFLLRLQEDLKKGFLKKYKVNLVKTNNVAQKLKR